MPIITFWTEIEKEIGQTASAIAMATQMAMEHNSKILLLTTYNNNELKGAFWKRTEETRKQSLFASLHQTDANNISQAAFHNGMAGILMAISSNKLMPEHITDYTKPVLKGRLEVLAGAGTSEEEYRNEIINCYPELIKKANLYYDYVIVDLNKEWNNAVKEVLEASTIIAYGINQKYGIIEKFTKSVKEGFFAGKQNIVPYIGRYDRFSKFTNKNISRTTKIKNIAAVPYNTLFAESCDEGMAAEYFIKMSTIKGKDRNLDFVNEVREFVNAILYKEQELKMYHGER